MRHTFSETWSGIRRNGSMTIAVIVTMWVSLTLFGAGLMVNQQVNLMKADWYDKIEVRVFLCNATTPGDNCDAGQEVTQEQKAQIEQTLRSNPEVAEVTYQSKEQAFAEFRAAYANTPTADYLTVDQMQESYSVRLKNPEEYQGVVSSVQGLKGVQNVQDLRGILDGLFEWMNLAQWGTIIAAALLLLAAALQIANTIRMAAFARRREIGIMRMVGASNWYILAPFLLETLFAAVISIVLTCVTLAAGHYFLIVQKAQVLIQGSPWIGWSHVGIAMLGVAVVGVLLSIIPTLIATRRYLRV
ncbi:permease-like cell division protein FtsX [Granulicoccus phenolivorans]|uniref:permease-like cell division protein FtsX n=1 Tax=Granulicoccus phenolivorans TaxID=266854 RepID=UPI000420371B|nr:permease-like cell division protein FtsX [Granulicoccus phenolivorans]